ncbi:sigma-70 family RNA polymerase sigma factor [Candidatus Dojkabacteria bacterium]|nr:sigma-70 family RNA polymerase sigma factor [Candidatus Dojkabacteria bacterium]
MERKETQKGKLKSLDIFIEDVYNTNFTKIYRFFYYKILSREKAEDLTSETFLIFMEKIREKKVIENPKSFLYGIAKIVFMRFLKQKYKEPVLIDDDSNFFSYVEEFVREADQETPEERLLKYLDKIPEKQRTVIKLRLIKKLSLKEIALKLKKNMNYVKTTQKRAIKSLRKTIQTGDPVHYN